MRCAIATCPNDGRKKSPFCKTCASAFGYAVRKLKENPNWVKDRKGKLDKWTDRMLYLGDTEKGKPYASKIKRAFREKRA